MTEITLAPSIKRIGIDLRMLGNRHGGIGRYCFELTRNILELDRRNEYVLFFNKRLTDHKDIEFFKKYANVKIVETKIRHYSLGEQISFLRILNKENLDLVHFPNFNVPVLYKKPFVVTIHDLVHHKIGGAKKSHYFHFKAYKKVIETAAGKASKIITVSEYSKKDIVNFLQVPEEKVEVVYEGPSLSTDISQEEVNAVRKNFLLQNPYFLFVGVQERKKNIISLTRALDVLLKRHDINVDLVIAGPKDSHYPDIKYKALDIKFKDRVVFTGFLSDRELAALYKGAYAYVSASLHEGFGLPGVEAMRFGLPLAVSNIEVFNEIYDEAAIYFNPLDVDDIAEKMHLLTRDTAFYENLKNKSFKRAGLFDWKVSAQKTLKVYESAENKTNI